jgi:hypothetical protein
MGPLLLLLQLVNFVVPIRPWGSLTILTLGVLGLALHRRGLRDLLARLRRTPITVLLILAAFAALIALRSATPLVEGDSGEYHLATVAWNASYPVVRGLGNLMARLAFNQSFFLYAAMLDSGPFVGNAYQLANGMLLFQVVVLGIFAIRRLFTSTRQLAPRLLFYALMLAPALHQMNDERFFSLSPDTAPFLLGIVVVGELLGALLRSDPPLEARDVTLITLLCAAGVACKQSFLVFAIASTVIIWTAYGIQARRTGQARPLRALLPALAVALLVGAAWLGRGILLSGYSFFPPPRSPCLSNGAFPNRSPAVSWVDRDPRSNPGLAPQDILQAPIGSGAGCAAC